MTHTPDTSLAAMRAQRLTLSNGIDLLHNHTTSNRSVAVRAILRAGASREERSQQGLASFTGRMLRQGTEAIPRERLSEELDGMGAGLSVDVGYATVSASLKCLSEDVPRAIEILAEVLRRPTFPANEMEKLRGQVLTELREAENDTRYMADRTWRDQAYPDSHRYKRSVTGARDTISRFTREDLQAFHAARYGANQTSFIVVGDVAAELALDLLGETFGDWRTVRTDPVEESLPASDLPAAGRHVVALQGKTQADVVLGMPTLDRTSPDFYALAFANHILGRMYFMGRFGEKVRDEQGLAYYATSELQGGFGRGPWLVRAGVNPRNLERAIDSIRTEIDRFLESGPTEGEMSDGVQSLVGSLPRHLESNEGAASVLAEIELYDVGLDYLERYPTIMGSLTHEEVVQAARRWIVPADLVVGIAGPPLSGD